MKKDEIMPILRYYFVCEDEKCLDHNIKALYSIKDNKTLFSVWEDQNADLLMIMYSIRRYIPNKSRALFDMYIKHLLKQGKFLHEKQKKM